MPFLLHAFFDGEELDRHTFKGQMPMPISSLINDTQFITLDIEPNKTYLIRMISISALFPHKISFGKRVGIARLEVCGPSAEYCVAEDHEMTVVAIDGFPTKPKRTNAVTIAAGQRYVYALQKLVTWYWLTWFADMMF